MSDRRCRLGIVVVVAAWLVAMGLPAQARPPHKKALADYLGPGLARKLNDCRTCHLRARGGCRRRRGSAAQRVRQAAQGRARRSSRRPASPRASRRGSRPSPTRTATATASPTCSSWSPATSPARPTIRPAAAELARGRAAIAALERARSGYPWNPFERVERPDVPSVRSPRLGPQPDRCLHRRRARSPRPDAPPRGEPAGAPAPAVPRPDRPAAHARRAARLPRRRIRRRV